MESNGKKMLALCGFSELHTTTKLVLRHEGVLVEWRTEPWQGEDSLELLRSTPVDVLVLRPNLNLTRRIQDALSEMPNKPVVLLAEYVTEASLNQYLALAA